MADRGDEGAVKQAPPEVEVIVDAPAAEPPIPSQEAGQTQKEKHARVDELQSEEKEQLQKREMEEADGSSIPAKYAEAMLTVDEKQG